MAKFTGRSAEGMGEVKGTVRQVRYHSEVLHDGGHIELLGWSEAFEVRASEAIRPFSLHMVGRQAHLVEARV